MARHSKQSPGRSKVPSWPAIGVVVAALGVVVALITGGYLNFLPVKVEMRDVSVHSLFSSASNSDDPVFVKPSGDMGSCSLGFGIAAAFHKVVGGMAVVERVEVEVVELEPIEEPQIRLVAVALSDKVLVYAVNDGWGTAFGLNTSVDVRANSSQNTGVDTNPSSNDRPFDEPETYQVAKLEPGAVARVALVNFDVEKLHAGQGGATTTPVSISVTVEDGSGATAPNSWGVGLSDETGLEVVYGGTGGEGMKKASFACVIDVDEGAGTYEVSRYEVTTGFDNECVADVSLFPTKSCRMKARLLFSVSSNEFATGFYEESVTVPVYEPVSLVRADSEFLSELRAIGIAPDEVVTQAVSNMRYDAEARAKGDFGDER